MEEDLKASILEPTKDTMEDLTTKDTMEDHTIMDLVVVGLTVVAEFQVHIYFLVFDNIQENFF